MTCIYIVTEDLLSESIVEKALIESVNNFEIVSRMGKQGNGYLRNKTRELIRLANNVPVLMLTDLDDFDCVPNFLKCWPRIENFPNDLLLRVVVKEIEAWLLADRNGFSDYFSVPIRQIPLDSEVIPDPKATLLSLIDRYSSRDKKQDVVRNNGSGLKQGVSYNPRLVAYINHCWSIDRASRNSDSLKRMRRRIDAI